LFEVTTSEPGGTSRSDVGHQVGTWTNPLPWIGRVGLLARGPSHQAPAILPASAFQTRLSVDLTAKTLSVRETLRGPCNGSLWVIG